MGRAILVETTDMMTKTKLARVRVRVGVTRFVTQFFVVSESLVFLLRTAAPIFNQPT